MAKFKNVEERDDFIRGIDRRQRDMHNALSHTDQQVDRVAGAVARWKNDRAVTLLVQSFLAELDRCPSLHKKGEVFYAEEDAEIDASAVNEVLMRLRQTLRQMTSVHVPTIR